MILSSKRKSGVYRFHSIDGFLGLLINCTLIGGRISTFDISYFLLDYRWAWFLVPNQAKERQRKCPML